MHTRTALLLIAIACTACAGNSARSAAFSLAERVPVQPMNHAESRLGPPSPRGIGLRRIDRPMAAEASLARY